ncbi:hypothetical protein RHE_CH01972 [Rhizobium etli CFN 42]|uniref:Uncharacterized protein n=1 Tax=Rhizobium etli (strain ATCC 51251 / DSM 11541 / JCM 21823 / NBRC 15573 / CFN 42) TaxID=347834 RepID=Q2K8S9_RHIEC|nr:hypothetical protein [Rhizobium etli]ABC90757.1 hypothetical protein RHE_CH01972 [Rhizobium etli CFN 42]
MTKVYTGSVFGIRELTDKQREAARDELAWLEGDLIRRRKRLAYWALRKHQADTLPNIREELRQSAIYFHARAQELVNSGERLRAYLVAELQDQPEHLPAYHYAH